MKIARLLLISCVLVASAVAQTPNNQTSMNQIKPGILGYLDPQSGAFRPVPMAPADDSVEPPPVTTYTGTITVTLTITVKSTSLTTFTCDANVSVEDEITTTPRGYEESANATATGSGTTRTCKLTIPYAWSLGTQSSDSMTISYIAFGSSTSPVAQRTSGLSPLETIKVPASGATTAVTAAVTL